MFVEHVMDDIENQLFYAGPGSVLQRTIDLCRVSLLVFVLTSGGNFMNFKTRNFGNVFVAFAY